MVKPLIQLHPLTVFVIRPEPGASRVVSAIKAVGGKALAMPVMEIAEKTLGLRVKEDLWVSHSPCTSESPAAI